MKKRVMSILLVLAMLTSMFAVSAAAEDQTSSSQKTYLTGLVYCSGNTGPNTPLNFNTDEQQAAALGVWENRTEDYQFFYGTGSEYLEVTELSCSSKTTDGEDILTIHQETTPGVTYWQLYGNRLGTATLAYSYTVNGVKQTGTCDIRVVLPDQAFYTADARTEANLLRHPTSYDQDKGVTIWFFNGWNFTTGEQNSMSVTIGGQPFSSDYGTLENCGANGFKFTLNPGIDFEKLIQDGTLKNSDLQVAAGSWSCGTTLETGTNQNGPSGNEQFVPDMFLYTDEACTQQASSNMAYDKTKGLTLYFHKSSSDFSAEERSNLKAMLGTTELTPVWKNDSTYLITIEPNLDLGKRSGDTDLVITAGTSTCCFTLEVPQLLYCYGGNVPESNDQTFEQGRLRPVVSDSFDLKNSGAIKFYYGTIDSNSNVEVTSISSSDPDVMKLTPKSVNGAYWWVCETFSKEDTVTLTYTYGEKPNEVTGTAEVVVSLPD